MPATQIIPYLVCRDVAATMNFLSRAFGFREEMRVETPSGGIHAEMSLDGQRIMLGQPWPEWKMLPPAAAGSATQGVFIYLPGVDEVHARAAAAGADILQAPKDENYGRTFTVRDPDGHLWFLTTPPGGTGG
jgi:uncharacterized glyoxalase superfamily protein PhnB